MNNKTKYMNPYLAGVLLGIVVVFANYISGRGLGASGAVKRTIVSVVQTVAPEHAQNALFYKEFSENHPGNPLKTWLVIEMFGVLIGGFVSGAVAKRLKFNVERSPKITSRKRLIFALAGGTLFGYGAAMGRGCTSGAALSGMSVLSLGGFITMMAIFGTAFAFAYFFRKNWI